ncbi:MAG: hypothetical protein ACR2OB_06405 [Solirubrobacteraceae bacterium]
MATENKTTRPSEPTRYRLSATERRAARLAEVANKQADLKREAAERRAKRAAHVTPNSPGPSAG